MDTDFVREDRAEADQRDPGYPVPLPRQQDPHTLGPLNSPSAVTVESPVPGNWHAGFGERRGETGQWQHRHRAPRRLNQELGFGSGSTCWRRLADWQRAGVWEQLHEGLLARLRAADQLDFSRAVVDSSQIQAKWGRGCPKVGPSPVDRVRPGSKHHVVTDACGTPLRMVLTGSNRNDGTQLVPLVEAIPPVRGRPGRPRRKPRRV